jgi:hypothetical protein
VSVLCALAEVQFVVEPILPMVVGVRVRCRTGTSLIKGNRRPFWIWDLHRSENAVGGPLASGCECPKLNISNNRHPSGSRATNTSPPRQFEHVVPHLLSSVLGLSGPRLWPISGRGHPSQRSPAADVQLQRKLHIGVCSGVIALFRANLAALRIYLGSLARQIA